MHICRHICIGIYVCMHIHKYTYYTHTYVVMDECMYGHMYVDIYAISMYTFRYVYQHTYMSLHAYAYMKLCIYPYMYVGRCVYICHRGAVYVYIYVTRVQSLRQ